MRLWRRLASVAALVVAACAPTPHSPAANTPSAAPSPSGAVLTVWAPPELASAITSVAKDFEASQGVQLKVEPKALEEMEREVSSAAAGAGPDVFVGSHVWLPRLVEAQAVKPIQLTNSAEFPPVAVRAVTSNHQVFAVPYALDSVALLRNTALIPDAMPATWDELLKAADAARTPTACAISTNGETGDAYVMYPFQSSFGSTVMADNGMHVALGGAEGEAFATWLHANGKAGRLSTTMDYATSKQQFLDGKAAFTVQPVSELSSFQQMSLAVGPVPRAGKQPASPLVTVTGFYLSAHSAHPDVAQRFLTTVMATSSAQRALYDAQPGIPAMTTVAHQLPAHEPYRGFYEAAAVGVPLPAGLERVWDAWNSAEANIIGGAEPIATWRAMVKELS